MEEFLVEQIHSVFVGSLPSPPIITILWEPKLFLPVSYVVPTENRFHVVPSTAEENLNKNDPKYIRENVWKYAVDTASLKANEVLARGVEQNSMRVSDVGAKYEKEEFMVIGSDTIVVYENKIYGKPKDKDDAKRILKELSGKTHHVISGVVILFSNNKNCDYNNTEDAKNVTETKFHATTEVEFDDLTDSVIQAYVETGEPFDKAGAYGIQGLGGTLVKRINGDYYNVVGFPLNLFCKTITKLYCEV